MTHSLLHALPLLLVASILHAQPASAPSGPASSPSVGLGARYESQPAGIAFRPPADMEPLKQSATVERVVTYVNEKQKMVFSVTRLVLAQPLPLLTPEVNKPGLRRPDPGLLDMQETQLAAPPLLVELKHQAWGLEQELTDQGRRRVNLDPGLLDYDKLVLASFKPGPRKLYLDRQVWADVVLAFRHG